MSSWYSRSQARGFRRRHLLASLGLLGWRPSFLREIPFSFFLSLVIEDEDQKTKTREREIASAALRFRSPPFTGYYLI
jgi:hypothetical protein